MLFTVTFLGYYASTPSAGYTVFAADGSVLTARTIAGVVPLGHNAFQVAIATDDLTVPSTILWDDGLGTYAEPIAYNGASGGGGDTILVNDDLPCAT